jgi:transcriptional regulator
MYTPPFNTVDDEARVRAFVTEARSGWLVTVDPEGFPLATLLPIMWHGDRVIAHLARANPQWQQLPPGSPALIIVGGAEAYVSPSWYAAKAEHGKVVPTWNYSAVQLTGTVTVHQDPEWLRRAVTDLTETHEGGRTHPWQVTDAPEPYVDGQLRGIVGIEFTLLRAEGKSKLSQNRSEADRHGVVDGLRADVATRIVSGAAAAQAEDMADEMAAALADPVEG